VKLGQALADSATIAILQRRASVRGETLIEQPQGALNSRITIEQAKGVLSSVGPIDVDEAFGKLHGFARYHNRLLTEVARTVVPRTPAAVGANGARIGQRAGMTTSKYPIE
jgi:AmiR/NasT family two-component response regulator